MAGLCPEHLLNAALATNISAVAACEAVVGAVADGAVGIKGGAAVAGGSFDPQGGDIEAVGVIAEGEGTGGGATCGVEAWDAGFGELAGGEVGDLDVEFKWGCPCEGFGTGGDGCVLEIEVMTAEELLERYATGERNFSGVDLSGFVLEEVCLDEINLERADLRGILIFRSTLRGATFNNANLEGADLSMTVLDGTNFREANLTNCRTLECSMIRTDFQDARTDGMIWDGYAYNTIMPDGRIVSDPDSGRDQRIAEGHEF